MKRSRRILLNTVSNAVLQCAGVGVSFVLMPLLLRYFGKEVFGIHSYVLSIVLLFTFVSSAISMSLMKFIPESLAQGDYDMFRRCLSTTTLCSFAVNGVAAVLVGTFPVYGASWFGIPSDLHVLARQVFAVMGVGILLQSLLPVINGLYYGLELFVLRNSIQLVVLLTNVLGYGVVVIYKGTLTHYVIITQGGIIASMVLAGAVILRRLPCRLTWMAPTWSLLKRTLSLNLFLISNQAADSLLYAVDKIILQKLFGAVAVTDYHVARRTHALMQRVISLPLSAIIPSLSRAYASGDADYIRMMNRVGSLLYGVLLVPPLIVLFCMFDIFIVLWVGEGFARTVVAGRLFVLTIVMVVPLKVFSHSLVANGRVKELGVAKVSYALLNVPLSILLALRLGFIGVVIPSVAYWLVVHPVLVVVLAARQRLAKPLLLNMALVAVMLLCAWFLAGLIPPIYSGTWLGLALQGGVLYVVVLCLYGGLASLLCLSDLRRLWSRFAGWGRGV